MHRGELPCLPAPAILSTLAARLHLPANQRANLPERKLPKEATVQELHDVTDEQPDKLVVSQEAKYWAAEYNRRFPELRLTEAFQRAMNQAADERQAAMPDYIDLFRLIRGAGRSNVAKAKAVDAAIRSIGKGGM